MKNCSMSLATKECKYKKIRYYYTSIKMNRMTKFGALTALNGC